MEYTSLVSVDSVKKSLRIDHSEDDELLENYIQTAGQYIVSAIDSAYLDGSLSGERQFEFAISLLAQHWYLNRQEASATRIPVTVQAMIQQLRGLYLSLIHI